MTTPTDRIEDIDIDDLVDAYITYQNVVSNIFEDYKDNISSLYDLVKTRKDDLGVIMIDHIIRDISYYEDGYKNKPMITAVTEFRKTIWKELQEKAKRKKKD